MTAQTPQSALAGILDTVGFDPIPADHVQFTGADPILPSNFLIGATGASSIAACGLAAAEPKWNWLNWSSRGMRPGNGLNRGSALPSTRPVPHLPGLISRRMPPRLPAGTLTLSVIFIRREPGHYPAARCAEPALVDDLVAANAIFGYLLDLMGVQRAVGQFDYYRSPQDRQNFLSRLDNYFQSVGFQVRRP